MKKCDKCNSDILMGNCSCGSWFERGKEPRFAKLTENIILEFNKMNKNVFSADHYTGTCIVFFKGNHSKCMKVRKFIRSLESTE